jgi:hypothetical protein
MTKRLTVLTFNNAAVRRLLEALGVPQLAQSVTIRINNTSPVTIDCEYIPVDVSEAELDEIIAKLELSKPVIDV